MVQGGFKEVHEKMDKGFGEVNGRLDKVERRLDIIENKLIERHDREIEQLRDRMLKVETKLAKV